MFRATKTEKQPRKNIARKIGGTVWSKFKFHLVRSFGLRTPTQFSYETFHTYTEIKQTSYFTRRVRNHQRFEQNDLPATDYLEECVGWIL